MANFTASNVIKRIFTPLSEDSSKLIAPIRHNQNDRLVIMLSKEAKKFILKCRSFIDDKWGNPSYYFSQDIENRFRMFGFERLTGDSDYEVDATDTVAIILDAAFPQSQIVWANDDGATKKFFKTLLFRFILQNKGMEQRVTWRETKQVPSPSIPVMESSAFPLNEYQRVGTTSFLNQENVALFMEQGTGKTPTTISLFTSEASEHFKRTKTPYKVLIICPKSLRTNWQREIIKFSSVKGRVSIIHGTAEQRLDLLSRAIHPKSNKGEIFFAVIASYESFTKSSLHFLLPEWDRVVLDESHYIKDPTTNRAKAMLALRDRCDRRTILTGTPVCNGIKDLYCQLEFLGEGMSGFASYKAFRDFYEIYEENEQERHGVRKVLGYKNMPFIQERLMRISHIISKKEALPHLPEKNYSMEDVFMTKEQQELYEQVQSSLQIEIENKLAEAKESNSIVTINHILTMMMKLAQVTSGHLITSDVYSDDGEKLSSKDIHYINPNPKIDALIEILKNNESWEKTIVWACFKADIRRISAELKAHGIKHVLFFGETKDEDREIAVNAYNNDPEIKVFIGNPASAREGLNLWGYDPQKPEMETNTTKAIYFSQNWSFVNRAQSEDRCHRIGTRHAVQYIDLCIPGTIDEEIRKRVVDKKETASSVQDLRELASILFKALDKEEDD